MSGKEKETDDKAIATWSKFHPNGSVRDLTISSNNFYVQRIRPKKHFLRVTLGSMSITKRVYHFRACRYVDRTEKNERLSFSVQRNLCPIIYYTEGPF